MKILTVVGARPQFIKACMLSKTLKSNSKIEEIIVHTGQHYDDNMSAVFFKQLNLPKPDYYLGVGSGSHGEQTAKMLMDLEKVMTSVKPDIVLVYGDTNSTLAGSLAASKLHIPVAHVEAGLRSFNKKMPEEINRMITDHLSDYLFCPSNSAVENLRHEGINNRVYQIGDIMYESVSHFKPYALRQSSILKDLSLTENKYYLATLHRAENTDDPARLKSILEAIQQLQIEVVLPLHPRTKGKINQFKLTDIISSPSIKLIEPLNYLDMLAIASKARGILTDSGGLQKESYMLQVPCITLREETEWEETVRHGWNRLVGSSTQQILDAVTTIQIPKEHPSLFGDGKTSQRIIEILMKDFEKK
ncbi:UDP-N-acetylglucosamine 2-epimerase (non-hydrolyzing) [Halobacillus shinanisalinarum]|uniref:UDP-N-acetylglucosamine 2-epimerase (Non-hydrolyzing) n=1 Tax=Halobacillus shinanisalinarum TaxID=2932258 RepID=A0ABY4H256_9BACI|nr:UDP-N-acetylglucosamine 2-epimerase (non-hydrolyzing) [Halobacillus shinanisalinarum]UOQ94525.1 UDP-N-acetylglucosamine 2-epimerase (non-hydrolyzing) [Halobacillus shinanisalinarum]